MMIIPVIIIILHDLAKQAVFLHYRTAGLIYVLIPIVATGTSCLVVLTDLSMADFTHWFHTASSDERKFLFRRT